MVALKGANEKLAVTSKEKSSDSSQSHAKGFIKRKRKWRYQKKIKM